MNKEYLKKAQPIVYQTLSNALKTKELRMPIYFTDQKVQVN